jgi:hypothetical protein
MRKNKKPLMKPKDLPMNQASGMPSTPTSTEPGRSSATTSRVAPSYALYHQSCDTLIYGEFLKILTTGDLRPLVIEGEPTEEDLKTAWDKILSEYSERITTEKTGNIISLWKRIIYTKWQISFLDIALDYLKQEYDAEIAEQVMMAGFDMIEDLESREDYLRQIYSIETEAKTLIVILNQLYNEYKILHPHGETIERTMADYDKELAILSKHVGFWIRKNEVTVADVASIVSIYMDYVKSLEK